MRILASGDGTLSARGELRDGRPTPAEFIARTTTDDDTVDVKLTFENGNVRDDDRLDAGAAIPTASN